MVRTEASTTCREKTRAFAPKQANPTLSVKHVLLATDFSSNSRAALPYATAICRHFGSTLHVAHVFSETSLLLMSEGVDLAGMGTLYQDAQADATNHLQEVVAPLKDIPHRIHVRHGNVWENLAGIVEESEIDLIVVGTHGRTGLGKILLGSVAEDILRHAPCPVLTIGPNVCAPADLPVSDVTGCSIAPVEWKPRHILYAANFMSAAPPVVTIAMAKEFEARLTILHVIENSTKSPANPSADQVRQLQAVVPKAVMLPHEPEVAMEFGRAWQRIVKTAAERRVDLIVLGAHCADHTTHLPWSTVHQVVAHAICPVLTVRSTA